MKKKILTMGQSKASPVLENEVSIHPVLWSKHFCVVVDPTSPLGFPKRQTSLDASCPFGNVYTQLQSSHGLRGDTVPTVLATCLEEPAWGDWEHGSAGSYGHTRRPGPTSSDVWQGAMGVDYNGCTLVNSISLWWSFPMLELPQFIYFFPGSCR